MGSGSSVIAASSYIEGVTAMPADETVAAVVDAVTSEAERDCQQLEDQLLGEDLGERVFKSSELLSCRVGSQYEELLGQKLDGVRERLMRARAAVAAALLSAPQ